MVFPVVMYGCESWTIKKAECQRISAFPRFYSYLPEEAGFGNMSDLTGALLASAQLLPFQCHADKATNLSVDWSEVREQDRPSLRMQ